MTPVPAVIRIPSYEQAKDDPALYAHASRVLHKETNPHNARPLIQAHGDREVWLNTPANSRWRQTNWTGCSNYLIPGSPTLAMAMPAYPPMK